jgi:tRNA/rRNA methyltransferase
MIELCRIVLVRPEVAGNIGAVARVMCNFGLNDLVLVQPKGDHQSTQARSRAANAENLLEQARIVESLEAALVGCMASAATSARADGIIRGTGVGTPEQVIGQMTPLLQHGPVALVFGPEPSGLTNNEVSRCDQLMTIPTSSVYPVLNLSHAVAICVYELYRQAGAMQESSEEPPAHDDEREAMLQHLKAGLQDLHFLWDEKAEQLFHGLRRLICRARPTANEVSLLHGIARQMQWVVRNQYSIVESASKLGDG